MIGRIILEKIDFEKIPQKGQISPKSKVVNLNFLTILDQFWDLLIIILWKMDFEKSPKNGQISPKSKGVNLNFLTILDQTLMHLGKYPKPLSLFSHTPEVVRNYL